MEYLRERGFTEARRQALAGKLDTGDVGGIRSVVLELKNHKTINLGAIMNEVERERRVAGALIGAAVIKRRQHNVSQAYAVVSLADLASMLDCWLRA